MRICAQNIFFLQDGRTVVEYGPVFMTISAESAGEIVLEAAKAGGEKALILLDELSHHLAVAKQLISRIKPCSTYPEVLRRMIEAVAALEEDDYTPMAAVAGVFSDLILQETLKSGGATVVVNNGGDVALQLEAGRFINVGIVRDVKSGECSHTIEVSPRSGIRGIATSGFGGRSLTKGVASAVTTFSASCSLADAAATSVANATNCHSEAVKRCQAEELDYQTDLFGHEVTCRVDPLSEAEKLSALGNGLKRARALYAGRVISGAVIYVQDRVAMYPDGLVRERPD